MNKLLPATKLPSCFREVMLTFPPSHQQGSLASVGHPNQGHVVHHSQLQFQAGPGNVGRLGALWVVMNL